MHLVAGRARNLIPGVAACQPSHLRRLIQMAAETEFIGSRCRKLGGIADVVGRRPFGVRLAGAVTGLALAPLPAPFGIRRQLMMRVLCEAVVNIFMTDLAGVRSGVARRKGLRGRQSRPEEPE